MTVIGLDDTDSRERGMCTTYVAARLARALRERGVRIERLLLVRLNPAVEYKTRGNAALAVHADCDPDVGFATARDLVAATAETADPNTHPGLAVWPGAPEAVPEAVAAHARAAVTEHLALADARALADECGAASETWKAGRGLVGALAAVGAWRAFAEWTYERIAYRDDDRWGTEREVDRESVFAVADEHYPTVWDTVDRVEETAVCVPRTPGPVLHGVRGDDADAVRDASAAIESEPVALAETFVTNQGTDAHLRDATTRTRPAGTGGTQAGRGDGGAGALAALEDGHAYCVDGRVVAAPETRAGGHVFFSIADPEPGVRAGAPGEPGRTRPEDRDADVRVQCVAFEPTKRFRDRVRALREGDVLTVCGEFDATTHGETGARGTLKLEKFAVRALRTTEPAVPRCPDCDRSMESAGRDQGYRCRDCGTHADGTVQRPIERALDRGWYEVPPCARRHVAKPLVRGGFDAPVHPEW